MPRWAKRFDLTFLFDVLEHVPDDRSYGLRFGKGLRD